VNLGAGPGVSPNPDLRRGGMGLGARPLLVVVAVVCLAAVSAALVTQHLYDMQPCPWCVLQRLEFVLVAVVALVGAVVPARGVQRAASAGAGLLALAGIATALWQHFVAASSTSCNLTFADRVMSATGLDTLWPEVFAAYASCADAKVNLLGVPYEFWSLAIFAGLAALALRAARPSHH
jgi:disulfide bond formation protein DsbB